MPRGSEHYWGKATHGDLVGKHMTLPPTSRHTWAHVIMTVQNIQTTRTKKKKLPAVFLNCTRKYNGGLQDAVVPCHVIM